MRGQDEPCTQLVGLACNDRIESIARKSSAEALEEEQQRIVPAPFEFIANWADLL